MSSKRYFDIPKIGSIKNVRDGILVKELPPVGDSELAKYTWRWAVPNGCADGAVAYFKRPQGRKFAGHWHARETNKDPELFLLLTGIFKFTFEDVWGNRREELLDATKENPVRVEIAPYIMHWAEAVTDVVYIEFQSGPFDLKNNRNLEEWEFLKNEYLKR